MGVECDFRGCFERCRLVKGPCLCEPDIDCKHRCTVKACAPLTVDSRHSPWLGVRLMGGETKPRMGTPSRLLAVSSFLGLGPRDNAGHVRSALAADYRPRSGS